MLVTGLLTPPNSDALQLLLGATTAVCHNAPADAEILINTTKLSGLETNLLAISPTVIKHLLQQTVQTPHIDALNEQFVYACHTKFPHGTPTAGTLCLLAACGHIEVWNPTLFFNTFAHPTALWGAIAATWFAINNLAEERNERVEHVSQTLCLTIAKHIT